MNLSPQGTEFTDNNVHEGKAYEYRVSAVNAAGTGRASDASEVIIARTMKGKTTKQSRKFSSKVSVSVL